jgi:hypothetical protein
LKSLNIKLLPRGNAFIEPPFSGSFAGVEIHDSNNPDARCSLIKPSHRAAALANRSGKADTAMKLWEAKFGARLVGQAPSCIFMAGVTKMRQPQKATSVGRPLLVLLLRRILTICAKLNLKSRGKRKTTAEMTINCRDDGTH